MNKLHVGIMLNTVLYIHIYVSLFLSNDDAQQTTTILNNVMRYRTQLSLTVNGMNPEQRTLAGRQFTPEPPY